MVEKEKLACEKDDVEIEKRVLEIEKKELEKKLARMSSLQETMTRNEAFKVCQRRHFFVRQ